MEANIYLLTELMENSDESNPDIKVNESDPTCIFFTSGTTGLPKGAPLSNKTYILAAKSICAIPLVNKKSRNYTCLPLFHANAQLYSVTGMRCLGASLVLSDHFSPRNFFNKISKYKATYFNSIGGMMQILDVTFGEEDVPEHTAKFVAVGGTPKELWERFEKKFKVDIFEAYSMSEVPVLFGNFHPEKSKRKVGSFGKPIFADLGRETKIVDDHNQEVKAGVGELIQKGQDFMMKEYLNAPKATSEVFDADGWIHSGDIVRKDEEGYHYFVDRKKFIIRVAGENVSAFEVEDVVNSHPAIEQSAAIPVPDPIRGEEIKIFIKLKEGINDVNMEEIIEHCAQRLAYFKVPRYIEIVSKFPKTSTERIQKMTLKNEERARECHGWDRNKEIPDWRNKYYNIK
ncbi:crotonobetaine/carnitine-CoA ligase [Caldalkalibacillus uzonensis]|uniref:Crotonobetaine/carnitine-CoA ligase n=1 Tax=Caldalkalibacillus uzonensis TaxID=353224 RepID=A0ABU0CVX3_9BACI|nr:AMP-binding protein [Caldalkalibacillus uzonensis]MDQ0340535.1 crotonobetaine/carnitine-CoA ligase [Caldalkalibacillus uzonensis]